MCCPLVFASVWHHYCGFTLPKTQSQRQHWPLAVKRLRLNWTTSLRKGTNRLLTQSRTTIKKNNLHVNNHVNNRVKIVFNWNHRFIFGHVNALSFDLKETKKWQNAASCWRQSADPGSPDRWVATFNFLKTTDSSLKLISQNYKLCAVYSGYFHLRITVCKCNDNKVEVKWMKIHLWAALLENQTQTSNIKIM